jgi:hypothetical protein
MSSKIQKLGIGVAIVGVWGALVPYVGPVFGYDMGGGAAWTWTESRFTLHLLPGLLAVLGGMMMVGSARGRMRAGAALGAVGGAWFIVGPVIRPAWASSDGMMMMGSARGRMRAGAALGAVGGAWFIVGPVIRPAWASSDGMMMMGNGVWDQILTSLGYHSGTGVVILALAAFSLGVLTDVQAGDPPRTESTRPRADVRSDERSTSDQEPVSAA